MTILRIRSTAIAIVVVLICELGLAGCTQTNSHDGVEKLPQSDLEVHVERRGLTAAQCQEKGGVVVGDIGDGAIHRADYLCASGKKPISSLVYGTNEPISVEGAVCCT